MGADRVLSALELALLTQMRTVQRGKSVKVANKPGFWFGNQNKTKTETKTKCRAVQLKLFW